jgi:hypothetical protein
VPGHGWFWHDAAAVGVDAGAFCYIICSFAGVAQLVERNLAKVEVESSRLFSRSKFWGNLVLVWRCLNQGVINALNEVPSFHFGSCHNSKLHRRDSKAVMHRIANPCRSVRLRPAPPGFLARSASSAIVDGAFLFHNGASARVVKLVDTADLKSAAFLHKGRTGSIPVPGTTEISV